MVHWSTTLVAYNVMYVILTVRTLKTASATEDLNMSTTGTR